jgi:hypothetical protein
MKIIRLFGRLIVFSVLGILLNLLLGEILAESRRDWIRAERFYPRLQWQEFYQLPANSLDLVTIGSSLSLYGIDPYIIEEEIGLANFNLGSPHQPYAASYYILKEVFKYHKIKYVIFEIHYEMLTRTYTRPYKVYIFDNMKLSWNKLDYFIRGFSFSEKVKYFLPMLDRRNSLEYIYNKLSGRLGDQFSTKEHYAGKGFVSSDEVLDGESLEHKEYEWFDWAITSEARAYYSRIVQLAQAENAQVIVVNLPYPDVVKLVNEEQFLDNYREFVQINDEVILCDYQSEMCGNSCEEYFDECHFNQNGASRVTRVLAGRIAGLRK